MTPHHTPLHNTTIGVFLLITLLLAYYIRRTYRDVASYPLRTRLLAFADDMALVTATARRPLSTTPYPTRATKVLLAVTNHLEGNQLLVHNVKSATMVHNAPPPPLRSEDPPMNPVSTATYLGVQQAATANGVTLPPNLIRQLTRTNGQSDPKARATTQHHNTQKDKATYQHHMTPRNTLPHDITEDARTQHHANQQNTSHHNTTQHSMA